MNFHQTFNPMWGPRTVQGVQSNIQNQRYVRFWEYNLKQNFCVKTLTLICGPTYPPGIMFWANLKLLEDASKKVTVFYSLLVIEKKPFKILSLYIPMQISYPRNLHHWWCFQKKVTAFLAGFLIILLNANFS